MGNIFQPDAAQIRIIKSRLNRHDVAGFESIIR